MRSSRPMKSELGVTPVVECGVERYRSKNAAIARSRVDPSCRLAFIGRCTGTGKPQNSTRKTTVLPSVFVVPLLGSTRANFHKHGLE